MTEDAMMSEIRERMDASAQKCLAEYNERMARRYSLELFHDGEKVVFDACQTAQYEWVGQHTMHYILSEDWGNPEYFGVPAAASRYIQAILEQGRELTEGERTHYDCMCQEVREIYDGTIAQLFCNFWHLELGESCEGPFWGDDGQETAGVLRVTRVA